ncbi:hypothetical protein PM082_023223 [Marasmius tenuissimus]|nr:hypothetical protein PM082_023223 [Marasmius tenuissimus]
MFDFEIGTWLYDNSVAAIIEQPRNDDHFETAPTPLPTYFHCQLDTNGIITYFEDNFGDLLYLYASLGMIVENLLSNLARHCQLTFGAVVSENHPGILAHLPSTPPPEWHFEDRGHNIKEASYSEKVPSRVDFKLPPETHDALLNLRFSLCLPPKDRGQLRVAYLCQSVLLPDRLSHEDTYFMDEISFSITGSLSCNPLLGYLFVPPLGAHFIDGMYCISYPFSAPLFYWASDREGKNIIPEKHWDKYGIPKLAVKTWVGSSWGSHEYSAVQDHVRKKGYELDGKQYARAHGYPELIQVDPYDTRIEEMEERFEEESEDNTAKSWTFDNLHDREIEELKEEFEEESKDNATRSWVFNSIMAALGVYGASRS